MIAAIGIIWSPASAARSWTSIRLWESEKLITEHIIVTPLARRTLTQMCEEGVFETAGNKPTSLGWLVYEDSFWRWVEGLNR